MEILPVNELVLFILDSKFPIVKKKMFVLQEMMPLQYLYTMALEQDIKNSVASRKTSELLQNRCYQVGLCPRIRPCVQSPGWTPDSLPLS